MSIFLNGNKIASNGGNGLRQYSKYVSFSKDEIIVTTLNNIIYFYQSLVDDNINNDLSDDTKWTKINMLHDSALEIGDIGMSPYVDESKGLRRYLNGQKINIDSTTQKFLEWLKSVITIYPTLSCTEDEWQELKSNSDYFQVGKFVIDETLGTIRLPAIVNLQGVLDLTNLGVTVEAGLPNITGEFNNSDRRTNVTASGAFYKTTSDNSQYFSTQYTSSTTNQSFGFDASQSNSIYGNSETVQPESVQYPYFIQIATEAETENNITNEVQLNNPYTLLDSKFTETPLYNASWLNASYGTYYSYTVYPTVYEALLVERNTSITAGTTTTLPSGSTYTKRGLSIKTSTEDITDYDFVINTTDETFRLPTKTHEYTFQLDRYIVESKKATDEDLTWYNLYSDGWCEQGGYNEVSVSTEITVTLPKSYLAADYTVNMTPCYTANATASTPTVDPTLAVDSFSVWPVTGSYSGFFWTAFGYCTTPEVIASDINTYFYVGETVQNASLINAGRLIEIQYDSTTSTLIIS